MSTPYMHDNDKHRFVFKPLLIENADKAQPGELVIDPNDGAIYIQTEEGLISAAISTKNKLQELEDAGILQSALAYVNNSEIYSIYKKGNQVRLDEMLKLNNNMRYYAIRGTNKDTGLLEYVTGNLHNGVIENSLVDIIHDTSNPDLVFTGTAGVGILHTPSDILEGQVYFIDFYDASRKIISTVPAQIIEVSSLNFAMMPEYNCTNIKITTSQDTMINNPVTGEDEAVSYVYQGQSLESLEIWVSAIFADGSVKLINNDLATSRLVIQAPTEFDTGVVGNETTVTARFYTEEVNIDGAEDEELLNYASLTATRRIIVVDDVYTGVKSLIPVPFIKKVQTQSGSMSDIIDLRTFALYLDGKLEDVSKNTRLSVSSDFSSNEFDTIQNFTMSLGLGHSSTQFEEPVTLLMGTSPHYQFRTFGIQSAKWNMSMSKPLITTPVIQLDTMNNEFRNWMRLNADAAISSTDTYTHNTTQAGTLEAIKALGSVIVDGVTIIPTHFRVRSVINSSFIHTPSPIAINIAHTGFEFIDTSGERTLDSYISTNNGIPYPVIVEFLVFDAETEVYERISVVPFFTTTAMDWLEYDEGVIENGSEDPNCNGLVGI